MRVIWQAVVVSALAVGALAASARADIVVAQGVELQLPDGWGQQTDGPVTRLAPTATRGRRLEVHRIVRMLEPNAESILAAAQPLFPRARLEISKASPIERHGAKQVAAVGRLIHARGEIALDLLAIPAKRGAALMIAYAYADRDPILRKTNREILLSARVPGPRLTVHFFQPSTAGVRGASPAFVAEITDRVVGLDRQVRLPHPVPVLFQECGMPNAYYDRRQHSITLCHEYFDERYEMFRKAGLADASARKAAEGAMVFTFMHEFGHALHHELGLPITGRGEDAADEIAAIWLSATGGEKGKRIARLAAFAHYERSKLPTHRDAYWDAHSLSLQRVSAILCLMYAPDRTGIEPMMRGMRFPASELPRCQREYAAKLQSWRTLLRPHLRPARAEAQGAAR